MNGASLRGSAPHRGGDLDANLGAPSGLAFIALLEAFRATGGTAPGEIVARLLEEHHVGNAISLAKLVYTGQVFGFEWRGKRWIPMFQFDENDLALKVGAQRVLAALPSRWSQWRLASWFATANARLDGRSPADMLESDLDAVLSAAQAAQTPEAFALRRTPSQHAGVAQ